MCKGASAPVAAPFAPTTLPEPNFIDTSVAKFNAVKEIPVQQAPVQRVIEPPKVVSPQQVQMVPVQEVQMVPVQQVDMVPVQQVDMVPVQQVDMVPVQQVDMVPVQQVDMVPVQQVVTEVKEVKVLPS